MDKKLLFATGNKNKVKEIRAMLPSGYVIATMGEIGFHEDIPETGSTLEENAMLKARYLYERTGENVIAEDTGLEVDVLDGAPGVRTARFAGEAKDNVANMDLLLTKLNGKKNRAAQFRTVIALILNGKEYQFEGVAKGNIAEQLSGSKGFGYDPIFIPDGYEITFAEMEMNQKSAMSHRGKALQNLISFLEK